MSTISQNKLNELLTILDDLYNDCEEINANNECNINYNNLYLNDLK